MKNESLIEELKRHEGLRLKPYKCSANSWTIGFGRNLESVGISGEEALMMLKNDIQRSPALRFKPSIFRSSKMYMDYGRSIQLVGISEGEAKVMLFNDVARVKQELKATLPVYLRLNEKRQEVLINMCFNLGINRLLKFKRMIAALEKLNHPEAAREMMHSRWAVQVKGRAMELTEKMREG